jgi:glutathione S-transferase
MLMQNVAYEFVEVDVYAPDDRAMLVASNPTLKIPMLMDGQQVVLDSRVIFQYLCDKGLATPLSLVQQNMLTAIDSANDSFIHLFLLKRSEIENAPDKLFFKLQNERIVSVMAYFEKVVDDEAFTQWNYLSMSLFAMLDWLLFRDLYDLQSFPGLLAFHEKYRVETAAVETDPR